MSNVPSNFVLTTAYRRFAEFCDACRRYGYIGLCYGPPGVGKTLSAHYYTNWTQVNAFSPYHFTSAADLRVLLESHAVLYTPKVLTTPRALEQSIRGWRNRLRAIHVEAFRREEEAALERARQQDEATERGYCMPMIETPDALASPPFKKPRVMARWVAERYWQQQKEPPDPTTLVMIDETDRLKSAGLEQVRDIFDQGGIGLVLIGMPGLEKRLSRYPQLYSRVGFVHEFRALSAAEVRDLFAHQWRPPGVDLPEKGINHDDVLAAIIRITGGNFRLLDRLLTQVSRLVEINTLSEVTLEVVEAARESLVIGTT